MLSLTICKEHAIYNQLDEKVNLLKQKRNQSIQSAIDEYTKNVEQIKKQRHELKLKLFETGVFRLIRELSLAQNKRALLLPKEYISTEKFCSYSARRRTSEATFYINYIVGDDLIANVNFYDFPACSTLKSRVFLRKSEVKQQFNSLWAAHEPLSEHRLWNEDIWIAQNIRLMDVPPIINSWGAKRPTRINGLLECDEYCLLVPSIKTILKWVKRGVHKLKYSIGEKNHLAGHTLFPKGEWIFPIELLAVYSFDVQSVQQEE